LGRGYFGDRLVEGSTSIKKISGGGSGGGFPERISRLVAPVWAKANRGVSEIAGFGPAFFGSSPTAPAGALLISATNCG
jgi:hypothetical protein